LDSKDPKLRTTSGHNTFRSIKQYSKIKAKKGCAYLVIPDRITSKHALIGPKDNAPKIGGEELNQSSVGGKGCLGSQNYLGKSRAKSHDHLPPAIENSKKAKGKRVSEERNLEICLGPTPGTMSTKSKKGSTAPPGEERRDEWRSTGRVEKVKGRPKETWLVF